MLKELDLVALRAELPAHGLVSGDVGTIVLSYEDGRAFEVEFVTGDGRTIAVETLDADQVEAIAGHQVLHVRTLALT